MVAARIPILASAKIVKGKGLNPVNRLSPFSSRYRHLFTQSSSRPFFKLDENCRAYRLKSALFQIKTIAEN
jgi:hypothetical protein